MKYSKGKVADLDSDVVREDYNNITGTMILFDGRLCYIEGCDRDVGLTLTVNNNGKKDYYFCAQGRAFSKGNGKMIPGEPDYDVLEDFIDKFYEQVCYGVRCGGIPVIPDKIISWLVNNVGGISSINFTKPTAEDCPFNQ